MKNPSQTWQNLKRDILKSIQRIDDETSADYPGQHEPAWWLEMMEVADFVRKYTPSMYKSYTGPVLKVEGRGDILVTFIPSHERLPLTDEQVMVNGTLRKVREVECRIGFHHRDPAVWTSGNSNEPNSALNIMKIKYGKGKTKFGPGVEIELNGDEVATAIVAWLVAQQVHVSGPRTITVNGELCEAGQIYVDPSGFVITPKGKKLSGRGPKPETSMERFWYTAKVQDVINPKQIHYVFYGKTRPKIGSQCAGIATSNKVIGYKREKVPPLCSAAFIS
jgi:hypothetical protein